MTFILVETFFSYCCSKIRYYIYNGFPLKISPRWGPFLFEIFFLKQWFFEKTLLTISDFRVTYIRSFQRPDHVTFRLRSCLRHSTQSQRSQHKNIDPQSRHLAIVWYGIREN